MTESNRTTVDVGTVVRQTEDVNAVRKHARKRLVDLPEVDVVLRDTRALQRLGDGESWADTHDTGRETSDGGADVLGEDLETEFLCLATGHEEDTGNAVGDLRSVSTRRARVAPLRKGGADLGELFLRRAGTDAVVLRYEDLDALGRSGTGLGGSGGGGELEGLEGNDFLGEVAGGASGFGALLRDGGELVHAGAGDIEVYGWGRRRERSAVGG